MYIKKLNNLTLTSVVFELRPVILEQSITIYLTLTSVVFEFSSKRSI